MSAFLFILYLFTFEIYDGATSELSVCVCVYMAKKYHIFVIDANATAVAVAAAVNSCCIAITFFLSVRRQLLPKRENDPMFNRV